MIGFGQLAGLMDTAIDKIFPDADERQKAKVRLMELQHQSQFKELEIRMEAIVQEAKSSDPWTSRARPSFLYLMYVMILSSIPFGVLAAFHPDIAQDVTDGMKAWLAAIPTELYSLFGLGYLGYVNKRSQDKSVLLGNKQETGIFSKIFS